jgi:SAM-dependent methyltransferase
VTAILLTVLVVAGLAVNGLRLRGRVPPAVPDSGASPDGDGASSCGDGASSCGGDVSPGGDWVWITARETTADEATQAAAVPYARAEGLELLDLVPADLPVTAARDLVRAVDPREYRVSRLAIGRGAGAAVLVAKPVIERAGPVLDPAGPVRDPAGPVLGRAGAGLRRDPEPADLIAGIRRIRPYTRREGAAIAVAPRLRSADDDLAKRAARLRANGVIVGVHATLDVVPYALTVVALLTGWEWGIAAAVAYCLQPYLIFAGTGMRPRGLHVAALLRPVHDPCVWARTAAGRWRSAAELERDAEISTAAAYYRDALAEGTARFLDEHRADCPWCGSAGLSLAVRGPDLVLHKPGAFRMDRCGGCGHVFQNPRLRPEGLDFYYRDAYDGLGAASAEFVFATGTESYLGRARMLQPFTTPKAWLDVGAGHAHFCAVASEVWPDTVFDGLDQGAGILDAERRGWVLTGYRGEFRDLAGTLAGRYDVVSMHHYLEHTRDPLAELDAAARVLPPGGYLLIELPDPQWPLARFLGRYWMGWFQPQHQHMMPVGNLVTALAERGLRPVTIERGRAHQANDLVTAAFLMFSRLAPDRTVPWSSRKPTALTRAWQGLAWTAGVPVVVVGLLVDQALIRPLARRLDRGNAYRVLAQKEDAGGAR